MHCWQGNYWNFTSPPQQNQAARISHPPSSAFVIHLKFASRDTHATTITASLLIDAALHHTLHVHPTAPRKKNAIFQLIASFNTNTSYKTSIPRGEGLQSIFAFAGAGGHRDEPKQERGATNRVCSTPLPFIPSVPPHRTPRPSGPSSR